MSDILHDVNKIRACLNLPSIQELVVGKDKRDTVSKSLEFEAGKLEVDVYVNVTDFDEVENYEQFEKNLKYLGYKAWRSNPGTVSMVTPNSITEFITW